MRALLILSLLSQLSFGAGFCESLSRHIANVLPYRLEANKTGAPRSLKDQMESMRLNTPAIVGWGFLALAVPGWSYTVDARHAGIHNFFLEHYSNIAWMAVLAYFGTRVLGMQKRYLAHASHLAVAAYLNYVHEHLDSLRQGFVDNLDVQMGNIGILLGFGIANGMYRFSTRKLIEQYQEIEP